MGRHFIQMGPRSSRFSFSGQAVFAGSASTSNPTAVLLGGTGTFSPVGASNAAPAALFQSAGLLSPVGMSRVNATLAVPSTGVATWGGSSLTPTPTPPPPPSGTVATVTLQPTQTAVLPYTIGIYPAESAVSASQILISDDDTNLRSSVISTWPNGSARVMTVSGETAVTNGVAKQINLRPAVISETALTTARINGLVSNITINIPGIATNSITDFTTTLRTWWANARTICCRYKLALGADMEAVIDIQAFSPSNRAFVEVVIENCKMVSSAPVRPSAKTYTGATVSVNGTTIATVNSGFSAYSGNSDHRAFRAWYASTWVGGNPGGGLQGEMEVTHDTSSMQAHQMFYKVIVAGNSKATYASDTYTPFSVGLRLPNGGAPSAWPGNTNEMGAGGDSPQIGPLPIWDADYLQTGDKTARRGVLANALSCLSYAISYRDTGTGWVPNATQTAGRRTADDTWPGDIAIATGFNGLGGGAPCWEVAHCPTVGYMAFMCRPSPVFIELAQKTAMVNWSCFSTDGIVRQDTQIRSIGWAARSWAQAIYLTPDSDTTWKTAAINNLYANVQYWTTQNDGTEGNKLGFAFKNQRSAVSSYTNDDFEPGDAGLQRPSLEDEYAHVEIIKMAFSKPFPTSQASRQTELDAFADKCAEFPVRFVNEARRGEWRAIGASRITVSDSVTAYNFNNWGDVMAYTFSSDGAPQALSGVWTPGRPAPPASYSVLEQVTGAAANGGAYYDSYFWSNLVHAVERNIPGAYEAYNTVLTNLTNYTTWITGFADNPRWGCTPRTLFVPNYTLPSAGQAVRLVTTNNMAAVAPISTANLISGIRSGGDSYGSGTFIRDYSAAGAYVVANTGGHQAEFCRHGFGVDFAGPTWFIKADSRIGWGTGVAESNAGQLDSNGEYIGATPVPGEGHTYGHAIELPKYYGGGAKGSLMLIGHTDATSGQPTGIYAYRFDLNSTTPWSRASTNTWTSMTGFSLPDFIQNTCSVFDPIGKRLFMFANQSSNSGFYYYLNLAAGTLPAALVPQSAGNRSTIGYTPIYWYSPMHHAILWLEAVGAASASIIRGLDLRDLSVFQLTVSGTFPSASVYGGNVPRWHPPTKAFYWYEGTGTALIKLTPPNSNSWKTATWAFSTQSFSTPGGFQDYSVECPTRPTRHWTRFIYVPAINSFAFVATDPTATNSVSLIRPTSGGGGALASFTQSFTSTIDPITNNANWTHTAAQWINVRVFQSSGVFAARAQYYVEDGPDGPGGAAGPDFDDAYALVAQSQFNATSINYDCITQIHKTAAVFNGEAEILVNAAETSSTISGYENLFNVGNGSHQIVRWNGALGDFEPHDQGTISGGLNDGDWCRVRVVNTSGSVDITTYIARAATPTNWIQVGHFNDATSGRKTGARVGMAFYAHASDANKDNFGWRSFTAQQV